MMMEQIHREHGYMVRLLAILKKKWSMLKEEKPINYSLVKEIVDYLSTHSETVHHPKEDMLYRHFVEHYPASAEIKSLELEHQELAEKTQEFLLIVDMIRKMQLFLRKCLSNNLRILFRTRSIIWILKRKKYYL